MSEQEQNQLSGALDALWARFFPEMEQRVRLLETAADAAKSNRLSDEQREEAHAAAHKLAGVLGTFGLTRGTVLARELETMYAQENGRAAAQAGQLTEIAAELRVIVNSRK